MPNGSTPGRGSVFRVRAGVLVALCAAALTAGACAGPAQAAATPSVAAVDAAVAAPPTDREGRARLIVRLRSDADPDAEARGAAGNGAVVSHVYRNVFRGFAAAVPEQARRGLENNPRVLEITPDVDVVASGTQSAPPWGLDRVDQDALPLSDSYTYPNDAANVTAYVIDTGILAAHADFGGRVRSGYTAINDGRGTTDCNGHGTHVAGTIAGKVRGIAKAARPVAVRVLGCNGSGATSGVIAGLDWAAADHSPNTPAVANLSLGGPANTSMDAAVQGLIKDGVTVAVAAGNDTVDACTASPARAGAAVTVGATDRADQRASFSNYGTCLDLFAPGVEISSDWYTSTTATRSLNGTSMATPHVAGAAALLLSADPALTPADVTNKLLTSATPDVVGDPGAGSANRLLHVAPGTATAPTPVTIDDPGAQTGTTGTTVNLQLSASGGTGPYTWSATDLPPGLTIDTAGRISGTLTTAGTYPARISARDTLSLTGTRTVTWTITAATTCSGPQLTNSGFENGPTGWSAPAGVIAEHGSRAPAHAGTWSALLGGKGTAGTQTLSRTVTIPRGCTSYTLAFWMRVDTAETTSYFQYDKLTVKLGTTTLATYSNRNKSGYVEKRFNVASRAGQTVPLTFTATENSSRPTSFILDDITLTLS
jgi:subtilisin family serine protease